MSRTEERTTVLVFADGPEWDAVGDRPWFNVKNPTLLARYSVLDERFSVGVSEIERLHPDSVLIYPPL